MWFFTSSTVIVLFSAFKKYNKKRNNGSFKVSDKQAKMLLTIPVHQFINKKQQDYLIKNLKEFYKI